MPGKADDIHERRTTAKGAMIIREGERGDCAFLIQSGEVRVYSGPETQCVELAKLGPGQIFGEMALLFDEARSASVQALDKCTLVVITRDTLKKKMDKSDPTIRAILPMLMKRIIQTNNVLLQKQGSVNELIDTVNMIYQNIHASVPEAQRKVLENAVLPKLDELMNVIRLFCEKFSSK